MNALVPNRFLFDLEFALAYRGQFPPLDGSVAPWTNVERLPALGGLDGRPEFADVWACWNETGIAVACRIQGKRQPLQCDPQSYWTGDNLRVCIDTRGATDNKRATRFCQQFYFLATGGGAKGRDACGGVGKFQRAREEAPPVDAKALRVAAKVTTAGYSMTGFIPKECMPGFDPAEHPRIGFYYMLEDADHGQQYLTVGDELLWYADPSTWASAVLQLPPLPRGD